MTIILTCKNTAFTISMFPYSSFEVISYTDVKNGSGKVGKNINGVWPGLHSGEGLIKCMNR